MVKKLLSYFMLLSIGSGLFSCAEDDTYVPLAIGAIDDTAELQQNNSIEINVLANDTNVPSLGVLTPNSSSNGTVEVLDPNNTPNNPSDDTLLYTPNLNFVGEDVFTYSICNNEANCSTANVTVNVTPTSPVVFDVTEVPYATLSEYNFFEGDLKDLNPVYGVLPYDLNSALFSDYAKKKRFVWMPENVNAQYVNDYSSLGFPIGAVLIKNFYYDNVQPDNNTRIIETRLMINKAEGWIFANYIWNDEQTEAHFSLEASSTDIEWIHNGETKSVSYKIPPESECFTCHKISAIPMPIGPKPQNLNKNYTYSDGISNQLEKLQEFGYLGGEIPDNINSTINWEDESYPIDLRVRSYLDINCAHCHSEDAHCFYRPVRFEFNLNEEEINLGVCVEPEELFDGLNYIVSPGTIGRSMLHFRLSTTLAQRRMPLLGRTLVHEEAVEMVEEWINSLTTICN